ncbi:hypothetical protein ACHWQZ_G005581 [Mnemiopsis leidyi]
MDGLGSEPVRLLSKSTEKVKQTQHRDSEELDHSEPSSYQQKHLIPCYRKNPFRDKTRKIRSDHRQGLKIRSSNVLSQPEFVSCRSSNCSNSLYVGRVLDSHTTMHGFESEKHRSIFASRPRERGLRTQQNITHRSINTNYGRKAGPDSFQTYTWEIYCVKSEP